jgi:hypothetical protein
MATAYLPAPLQMAHSYQRAATCMLTCTSIMPSPSAQRCCGRQQAQGTHGRQLLRLAAAVASPTQCQVALVLVLAGLLAGVLGSARCCAPCKSR